jgi:hypothetical protein
MGSVNADDLHFGPLSFCSGHFILPECWHCKEIFSFFFDAGLPGLNGLITLLIGPPMVVLTSLALLSGFAFLGGKGVGSHYKIKNL